MEEGFPTKSPSFLGGQDILYDQFNEINFYVEDEFHENLYFEILRKKFTNIKFDKIFPLGGKKLVVDEAKENIGDKKKVFIVDKDFDDIFKLKENYENLFYLNEYSIENFFLEEDAIIELIIEEKPKEKRENIKRNFHLPSFIEEAKNLFKNLIENYLVIHEHDLGIENIKCNPSRFCEFNPNSKIKLFEFKRYENKIKNTLKEKDRRLKLEAQKRKFASEAKKKANIPGKYLINFLKSRISHLFNIQINWDSFIMRIAKLCKLDSLNPLKTSVSQYITT